MFKFVFSEAESPLDSHFSFLCIFYVLMLCCKNIGMDAIIQLNIKNRVLIWLRHKESLPLRITFTPGQSTYWCSRTVASTLHDTTTTSNKRVPSCEFFLQVFQPWIQKRRLAYAKHKHVIAGLLKHLNTRALGRLFREDGKPNTEVIEK